MKFLHAFTCYTRVYYLKLAERSWINYNQVTVIAT